MNLLRKLLERIRLDTDPEWLIRKLRRARMDGYWQGRAEMIHEIITIIRANDEAMAEAIMSELAEEKEDEDRGT